MSAGPGGNAPSPHGPRWPQTARGRCRRLFSAPLPSGPAAWAGADRRGLPRAALTDASCSPEQSREPSDAAHPERDHGVGQAVGAGGGRGGAVVRGEEARRGAGSGPGLGGCQGDLIPKPGHRQEGRPLQRSLVSQSLLCNRPGLQGASGSDGAGNLAPIRKQGCNSQLMTDEGLLVPASAQTHALQRPFFLRPVLHLNGKCVKAMTMFHVRRGLKNLGVRLLKMSWTVVISLCTEIT